ncbi:MAG TPA: nucleotidyltransferase family protein [Dehalococcoidia bacterium]|nr:nucleotidyltransferase family protein [Dehalococcoidia bacterium]
MVSAIMLAAGQAKRMGRLKQLMPLGKSTILEQSLDNLLGSKVGEVIVVLGHRAEEIKKIIAARPLKIAVNKDYRQGMGTSIAVGLKLVDNRAEAVMLTLGDQPFVDSPTIDRLIEEFRVHDKGIAIPTYQGKRGHPLIFSLKYEAPLAALKGDIGGREIIKEHPEDVLEVAVDCEGIVIDIDTMPHDLP